MSNIISRMVKGKEYYYLDESFKDGKKWVKESVYFGPEKPSQKQLLSAFEELKEKSKHKNHLVLVHPLTEFISNKKAFELQKAAENKKAFLKKLTPAQKE